MVRVNLTPSPELSYVVGAILADGTISKWSSNVVFASKDREFIEKVRDNLILITRGAKLKIHEYSFRQSYDHQKRGTILIISVHSAKLHNFLATGQYKAMLQEHPGEFLSGFLDGDGSVGVWHKLSGCSITFANTNQEFIELICNGLRKLNIEYQVIHRTKSCLQEVRLKHNSENVIRFCRAVNLSIPRKREALSKIGEIAIEMLKYHQHLQKMRNNIIELRLQGLSWRKIGQVLGTNQQKAWGYIYSAPNKMWNVAKTGPLGDLLNRSYVYENPIEKARKVNSGRTPWNKGLRKKVVGG